MKPGKAEGPRERVPSSVHLSFTTPAATDDHPHTTDALQTSTDNAAHRRQPPRRSTAPPQPDGWGPRRYVYPPSLAAEYCSRAVRPGAGAAPGPSARSRGIVPRAPGILPCASISESVASLPAGKLA